MPLPQLLHATALILRVLRCSVPLGIGNARHREAQMGVRLGGCDSLPCRPLELISRLSPTASAPASDTSSIAGGSIFGSP